MSSYPLECFICYKAFSGQGPASQHFISTEHRRKADHIAKAASRPGVHDCSVCHISCDTEKILRDHEQSPRHVAYLEKKHLFDSRNQQTYISAQAPMKNIPKKVNEHDTSQCNLCGVIYTSQVHAQSHLGGKAHIKKKALWEAMEKGGASNRSQQVVDRYVTQNVRDSEETAEKMLYVRREDASPMRVIHPNPLPNHTSTNINHSKCDVCDVNFSGQMSAEQHFCSEKHKKKVLLAQKEARGEALPLQCNACGVVLSGQESAEQHFESNKHKQTMANYKIKEKNPGMEQNINGSARSVKQSLTIFQTISKASTVNSYQLHQHHCPQEEDGDILAKPFPITGETDRPSPSELNVQNGMFTDNTVAEPFNRNDEKPFDGYNASDGQTVKRSLFGDSTEEFQPLRLDGDNCNISNANESIRYVHNHLHSPPVNMSIGRGRGIFSLLDPVDNSLSAKVSNTGRPTTDFSLSSGNVSIAEKIDEDTEKETVFGKRSFTHEPADKRLHTKANTQFTEGFPIANHQDVRNSLESFNQPSFARQQVQAHVSSDSGYIFDRSTGRGKCFICDIELTSVAHMKQHVSGQKHTKAKVVKEQNTVNGLSDSPLVCKVCTVTFTGFEAREQHMKSERHLAKEKALFMGKKDYFCEVCKVPCSGPDNYKQHLAGAQHLKMTGVGISDVTDALNLDRTQWYPCDICKCNLNSHEQLRIHKQSPKHLKQLERMTTTERALYYHQQEMGATELQRKMENSHIDSFDRTVWHHCEVCNCDLNTVDQLRVHQSSPAHLAKARNGKSYQPDTSVLASEVPQSSISTPLESFLSQPLFPDHFVSQVEQPHRPEINQHDELEFNELLDMLNPNTSCSSEMGAQSSTSSGQGGKAAFGSDIAWATRSRGDTENRTHDRKSSSDRSPHDGIENLGARAKQLDPTVNNPHAATHPYYCHTCKAPMNTKQSYEIHLKGKRHMQKVCIEPAPSREHPHAEGGQYPSCTKSQPRKYQNELFKKAMASDTLCFLPTGTGKTLVAVMTMSAMLNKCPTKNVLFLVDKVLLVLQQAKQIIKEIGGTKFVRFNPDSDTCLDLQRRELRIASVCMGQQNTNGVPLWQHDVVVVTADFCRNLLDKEILRWTDFSLVVFDEAHHCDKGHPFNTLLANYHQMTNIEDRPSILGLTASPAGKSDVPKTYQMLLKLIDNMGNVSMSVVEENVAVLKEYQSNAQMIIRPCIDQRESPVKNMLHEFNVYIVYCVIKLRTFSNIDYYVNCKNELYKDMTDEDIRRMADGFVNRNIDLIQSSVILLQNTTNIIDKIQLSLLARHVQSICLAWSSLMEGGVLCARQELEDLKLTDYNTNFAKNLGLPIDGLVQLLGLETSQFDNMFESAQDVDSSMDMNIRRLLNELTAQRGTVGQSISLVLVKQRGSAILISKVLQNSAKMRKLNLQTTYVVGHGTGSGDKGMTVNQQKRVLEEIKEFKYQVVVATSVAEEGVDWPECDCVISMYPPTTVTALVQMRGRARQKGSKFIILCASQDEENKLNDIMQREANMIAATKMFIEGKRNC